MKLKERYIFNQFSISLSAKAAKIFSNAIKVDILILKNSGNLILPYVSLYIIYIKSMEFIKQLLKAKK